MDDADSVKVLIVNEHGQFLAGNAAHWEFTDERVRARVFDYRQDHVPEQLRLIQRAHGTVWIAVKLDPREAFEFCDQCGRRLSARQIFFDGNRFLCRDCRRNVVAGDSRVMPPAGGIPNQIPKHALRDSQNG